MATLVQPRPGDDIRRPNVPSAANRLPAIADYEQVDRDIIATLGPTLGWFAALGVAILCLLIGAPGGTCQTHEALGAGGFPPPVMWGFYIVPFVCWVGIGHAGT